MGAIEGLKQEPNFITTDLMLAVYLRVHGCWIEELKAEDSNKVSFVFGEVPATLLDRWARGDRDGEIDAAIRVWRFLTGETRHVLSKHRMAVADKQFKRGVVIR